MKPVLEIEEFILLFCYRILNSSKLIILHKTFIAVTFAIAYCIVISNTNENFLEVNI